MIIISKVYENGQSYSESWECPEFIPLAAKIIISSSLYATLPKLYELRLPVNQINK